MAVSNESFVLSVGNRYFREISKKGSVMTSWCLSGAQFFMTEFEALEVQNKLTAKNKKSELLRILAVNSGGVLC